MPFWRPFLPAQRFALSGTTLAMALVYWQLPHSLQVSVCPHPQWAGEANPAKNQTGSIKWFNATKGFGFIVGDDGAEVFCTTEMSRA